VRVHPTCENGPDPQWGEAVHRAVGRLRARLGATAGSEQAYLLLTRLEDALWDPRPDPVAVWMAFGQLAQALPFPATDPDVQSLLAVLPPLP
jgi:hypothetical protein